MGKIDIEGHITISYMDIVVDLWRQQTPELKDILDEIGRPFGYSGMNVLYYYVLLRIINHLGSHQFVPWERRIG